MKNRIKIRLSEIGLFALYFPGFIQNGIRLLYISFLKSIGSYVAITGIIFFILISLLNGKAELKFILADSFIDFTLLFLLTSSFKNKIFELSSKATFLFTILVAFYFLFIYVNNIPPYIEDWRGKRFLFLFNGATGIITTTFFFNYFIFKRSWTLVVICFIAILLSQSRTAISAALVIILFSFIKNYKIYPYAIFLILLLSMSSTLLIPFLGINTTGRLDVWLSMIEVREEIKYFGDIYFYLDKMFPWEDQLHNLYLHLYLSRPIIYNLFLAFMLYNKFWYWIKAKNHYAISSMTIIMMLAATDNIFVYYFLFYFWI